MTGLLAAAVFTTAAALAAPTTPAAAVPPSDAVAAVQPAKQAAKRLWRSQTKAQHRYHCRHFTADRATYGRGFRYGARLNGATPRRARALWLGWRWQLARKCSEVTA